MSAENEFRVNEYLTLKLEGKETNIYVGGKLFQQCKFLMIAIPVEEIRSLDDIESVDEAADRLDSSLEVESAKIDPATEFWGHCSNIQTWVEQAYDTRLLHSNLAFPLLKALVDVGDPHAQKVFKEEIAMRLTSGYSNVVIYLLNEHFLEYLTVNEFESVIRDIINDVINMEDIWNRVDAYRELLKAFRYFIVDMESVEVINKVVSQIEVLNSNIINNFKDMKNIEDKINILGFIVKDLGLLNRILKTTKKLPDKTKEKISHILRNLMIENLNSLIGDVLNIVSSIKNMEDIWNRVNTYRNLMDAFRYFLVEMESVEVINKVFSQIEVLNSNIINSFKDMENIEDKIDILRFIVKDLGLLNRIRKDIKKLPDETKEEISHILNNLMVENLKQTRFNKNGEWEIHTKGWRKRFRRRYLSVDEYKILPKQCHFNADGEWEIDPYEDQYAHYFPLHGSEEMFFLHMQKKLGKLKSKPYLCAICKKYHAKGSNFYGRHLGFYVKFLEEEEYHLEEIEDDIRKVKEIFSDKKSIRASGKILKSSDESRAKEREIQDLKDRMAFLREEKRNVQKQLEKVDPSKNGS